MHRGARPPANTRIEHRLCAYAQQVLKQVVAATGVEYDWGARRHPGPDRRSETLERGIAILRILADAGQPMRRSTAIGLPKFDPALGPTKDRIAGAIYCPTDESGDAAKFSRALAAVCAERGANFRYRTTIIGLDVAGDRVERVMTHRTEVRGDCYVLALGSYSPLCPHPRPSASRFTPLRATR